MKVFLSIIGALFVNYSVFAETPEVKGTRIAQQVKAYNTGFIGESSSMKMTLVDAYGTKTERLMDGIGLEVPEDGNKFIMMFNRPHDVKGTKMLTWGHKDKDDDQWLYLPSLKRVKRISSRTRSSSFMGSEFSYEDLGSQEIEKYHYTFLKDSIVGKDAVWVLQRISRKKSGYSKEIVYISKKMHQAVKVEYFDRKNELLKIGTFSDFKEFKVGDKTFFRPSQIHMKNKQTKKESYFVVLSRQLGVKHANRKFSKNALK